MSFSGCIVPKHEIHVTCESTWSNYVMSRITDQLSRARCVRFFLCVPCRVSFSVIEEPWSEPWPQDSDGIWLCISKNVGFRVKHGDWRTQLTQRWVAEVQQNIKWACLHSFMCWVQISKRATVSVCLPIYLDDWPPHLMIRQLVGIKKTRKKQSFSRTV